MSRVLTRRPVDALPGRTSILVSRLRLGHRPAVDGLPACDTRAAVRRTTVAAAIGYRIPPCPDPACWGGGRPW